MITTVIILALLCLLVGTEPDSGATHSSAEESSSS